ncbi:MAG: hypothetical protein LLG04_04470 [Parachlamydia sp.]|nr:hypothetical protein [Parachlamydia sp.]
MKTAMPGIISPMTRLARVRIAGAKTGWEGSPTTSSVSALHSRYGMKGIPSSRSGCSGSLTARGTMGKM